jgi:hypothetical protein
VQQQCRRELAAHATHVARRSKRYTTFTRHITELTTSQCSGDRSGCEQCRAADQECTWPAQRKRHAFLHRPMRLSNELIAILQRTSAGLHRRTRASSTGDRESPASDTSSRLRRLSGSHHYRPQRISKPNHDYPSPSNAEQQDQC